MREIKFRAWDGKKMHIATFVDIRFHIVSAFHTHGIDTFIQFIGVKDKKGIEMYDGDIIKNKLGVKFIIEFSTINVWWYGRQIREKNDGYFGGIKGQELRKCEVIGNIYENPEMIK